MCFKMTVLHAISTPGKCYSEEKIKTKLILKVYHVARMRTCLPF